MKKILLYYPPNYRSVVIETICNALIEDGHEVIILALSDRGPIHSELEKMGIKINNYTISRKPSWKFFLKQSRNLIRICKREKIDFIWSHLQEAILPSLLAQPFLNAKVVAFRHHAESEFYAELGNKFEVKRNKKEALIDKMINRLAKKIIVPSSGVWRSMEEYEHCNMKKVKRIPYIYDFSKYQKPEDDKVLALRKQYQCNLMLIMVSRMVATKQHLPVFEVVNKMIKEGLSIKMLVMDDGPLKPQLEQYVLENNLEDKIIFTGFRQDFVNYMAASDLLIHPSLTEASNNVVKEMGLLQKAVAVCKGVGDFDDYIKEGENGYFLDPENLDSSIEQVIREAYKNPEKLEKVGTALKVSVLKYFSDTPENRKPYLELLQ
ncbi:MAG: glycosyltransferase family 4 protein [Bacteroidetes bacterium]|nr:glycosyltransferase family 4 protein [Bacteroidota bacterium]